MVVVPNGFDLSSFHPETSARDSVRAELDLEREASLVGWVGRFHPQKNVQGFLEAARQLHHRMPNVHIVMAGEGLDPANTAVMRPIKEYGLEGCTHLLGRRTDTPRIMAAIDVLASSSIGEAFANVVGEAMACGV